MHRSMAAAAALLVSILQAAPGAPGAAQTVESVHKGLSSGPLGQARLVNLPDGTLLRFGAQRVTQQQVSADIAKAPAAVQDQLRKNRFFVLEQRATRMLLAAEASAWAKRENKTGLTAGDALIRTYLQSIAAAVTVTDDDARAFYAANKDMVGGAPYDKVAAELKQYLANDKRQAAVDAHINGLSRRSAVQVDAAWCRTQARGAFSNPVDQARRSGKPALVDFGSVGCRPCDMLAPILDELRKTYAGKCSVLFVKVTENQLLAARYGISSIPVQVYFDKDGNEVSRHVGFHPKDQILTRLAAIGVK